MDYRNQFAYLRDRRRMREISPDRGSRSHKPGPADLRIVKVLQTI